MRRIIAAYLDGITLLDKLTMERPLNAICNRLEGSATAAAQVNHDINTFNIVFSGTALYATSQPYKEPAQSLQAKIRMCARMPLLVMFTLINLQRLTVTTSMAPRYEASATIGASYMHTGGREATTGSLSSSSSTAMRHFDIRCHLSSMLQSVVQQDW